MDAMKEPAARTSGVWMGVLCGAGAAFGWAAGFVAAKHGINVGFSPADLAFHRFFWSGLVMLPLLLIATASRISAALAGARGLVVAILAGPPQALRRLFRLHPGAARPWHHHTAGLRGAVRADSRLGGAGRAPDHPPYYRRRCHHRRAHRVRHRIALTTIGGHGVGGDLLFAHRRPVLGNFRHIAAALAHARHARHRCGRRVVAFDLRAALCAVRRLCQYSAHGLGRKPSAGRGAGRARRYAADLSVRARGDADRRRTRIDIPGAGAGLRSRHRLSGAGRRADHRTA